MTKRPRPSRPKKRLGKGKTLRQDKTLPTLRVHSRVGDRRKGLLQAGGAVMSCALGAGGVVQVKREGDGGSPRGRFRLRAGAYRPDHLARPATALPLRRTAPADGWCDDVRDRRYNRPIALPAPGVSAERMWRDDGLYDVVIDLDHNRGPIRPGRGSAIFLHIARPGYTPTEGCVALKRSDLLRLLGRFGPRTVLVIV